MSEFVFLLLMAICLGLIYVVHRYFGKHEFYLLISIYSVLSFLFSFKLVNIFSLNINPSIIFTSGLLIILYYFVNKYNREELKKFIITSMTCTLSVIVMLVISSLMVPSIYDDTLSLFRNLLSDNLIIVIMYPINLFIIYILSCYSFIELKKVIEKKLLKTFLTFVGIIFIDVFIFIYFSYAVIIRYDEALLIAINNYFIKIMIMAIYYLCINRVIKVKKVKS